jgi:hypothetical protein
MRPWVVVALLIAVGSSPLNGQEPSERAVPRILLERANTRNWQVRAVLLQNDTVVGRITSAGGHYRLNDNDLTSLDVVSLERLSESGGGGLPGAAVGAVLFGTVGHGVTTLSDTDPIWSDRFTVAAFATVGALIGLVAGNSIWPSTKRWVPLWPSP